MRVVNVMELQPGSCMACGGTPCDVNGHPLPAMDLEVDINWGDSAYLCYECMNIIADLIDRPSKEKVQKIVDQNKFLSKRSKKMAQQLRDLNDVVVRIKDGEAAMREVKTDVH